MRNRGSQGNEHRRPHLPLALGSAQPVARPATPWQACCAGLRNADKRISQAILCKGSPPPPPPPDGGGGGGGSILATVTTVSLLPRFASLSLTSRLIWTLTSLSSSVSKN